MAVIQITSREFREKQASMFALADNGEQVRIPAQCRPGSPVILGHLC